MSLTLTDEPLVSTLPSPEVVRDRLADALRRARLLRGLLKLSERAAEYRRCDELHEQRSKKARQPREPETATG